MCTGALRITLWGSQKVTLHVCNRNCAKLTSLFAQASLPSWNTWNVVPIVQRLQKSQVCIGRSFGHLPMWEAPTSQIWASRCDPFDFDSVDTCVRTKTQCLFRFKKEPSHRSRLTTFCCPSRAQSSSGVWTMAITSPRHLSTTSGEQCDDLEAASFGLYLCECGLCFQPTFRCSDANETQFPQTIRSSVVHDRAVHGNAKPVDRFLLLISLKFLPLTPRSKPVFVSPAHSSCSLWVSIWIPQPSAEDGL